MRKLLLLAALGMLSLNTMAQDTPKEEGFVFTTVKAVSYTHLDVYKRQTEKHPKASL